jgi:HNH endonuclease
VPGLSADDAQVFWEQAYESGNHLLWPGITLKFHSISVQRLAFMLTFGPIPKQHHVLSHCGVRGCLSPAHLHLAPRIARGFVFNK